MMKVLDASFVAADLQSADASPADYKSAATEHGRAHLPRISRTS
jgi:hypothetical protein